MKIKKLTILLFLFAFWICTFAGISLETKGEVKALFPDTVIYLEPSLTSEIVFNKVPQNAVVKVVGNPVKVGGVSFVEIEYTGFRGFVVESFLYEARPTESKVGETSMTVKTKKLGEPVPLFASHSESSEIVSYVADGKKLTRLTDGVDYGEFSAVSYNGKIFFIKNENLTKGLSLNQSIAVVIACLAAGLTGVCIFVYVKKRKAASAS